MRLNKQDHFFQEWCSESFRESALFPCRARPRRRLPGPVQLAQRGRSESKPESFWSPSSLRFTWARPRSRRVLLEGLEAIVGGLFIPRGPDDHDSHRTARLAPRSRTSRRHHRLALEHELRVLFKALAASIFLIVNGSSLWRRGARRHAEVRERRAICRPGVEDARVQGAGVIERLKFLLCSQASAVGRDDGGRADWAWITRIARFSFLLATP